MTPAIFQWVKSAIDLGHLPSDGVIYEIGSRDVNGSVRPLFSQKEYTGVDMEHGTGVDMIADSHHLMIPPGSVDITICLEMLEHDTKPWITRESLYEMLKPGGFMLISVPTNGFPEHKYPLDLFRFLPDAFTHFFFEDMDIVKVDTVSSKAGENTLIGIARKR